MCRTSQTTSLSPSAVWHLIDLEEWAGKRKILVVSINWNEFFCTIFESSARINIMNSLKPRPNSVIYKDFPLKKLEKRKETVFSIPDVSSFKAVDISSRNADNMSDDTRVRR